MGLHFFLSGSRLRSGNKETAELDVSSVLRSNGPQTMRGGGDFQLGLFLSDNNVLSSNVVQPLNDVKTVIKN